MAVGVRTASNPDLEPELMGFESKDISETCE